MKKIIIFCCLCASDKPGRPENVRVIAVTETSVTLRWDEPNDDGGSRVTGYTVQKQDRSGFRKNWTTVGNTKEMEMVIGDLTEGNTYLLQVQAENNVGAGPFAELSKPAEPKSQHGMLSTL